MIWKNCDGEAREQNDCFEAVAMMSQKSRKKLVWKKCHDNMREQNEVGLKELPWQGKKIIEWKLFEEVAMAA
jgi:hypothetical protein